MTASFTYAQKKTSPDSYIISDKFDFVIAPIADLGEPLVLWATNYHLPEIENGNGNFPLRDVDGIELGPRVSLAEWCKSALEGTVRILYDDGRVKTFNYDTSTDLFPNDCSAYYPFNLGNSKFKKSRGPFGEGSRNFRLAPYRTLATDPTIIPTGTVLFIPEARGAKIILKNNETIIHVGYFFAGDMGGAIKLNHVDVFIGLHKDSSFFPWVSNSSSRTFKAYIIKDVAIVNELTHLHRY